MCEGVKLTTGAESYIMFVLHRRISVLNDLFVQLDSYSFAMCHDGIFEQIRMDGWMKVVITEPFSNYCYLGVNCCRMF